MFNLKMQGDIGDQNLYSLTAHKQKYHLFVNAGSMTRQPFFSK